MARLRRLRGGLAGALLAFVLFGALMAQFHGRGRSVPAAVPGPFDFYLLSLSWAPEFCAQSGAAAGNARECASGRDIGFVVHGLWQELNEGRSPESCQPAKPVAKSVINFILPYMPSPGLIQHEWATHGTCTGMTQADYFTLVLRARSAVQIPVQFTSLAETAAETPSQIERQFAGSNPSLPVGAFRAICRNGALTEVRVCFDKELKPRACVASVGECAAASISIRAPR